MSSVWQISSEGLKPPIQIYLLFNNNDSFLFYILHAEMAYPCSGLSMQFIAKTID